MTAGLGGLVALALSAAAGPEPAPPPAPPPVTASPPSPVASPAPVGSAPWAELEWERAADADRCISREELARETEGVLRRAAFSGEGPAALRVRGAVGRDERGRWAATLALETPDGRSLGTRELTTDGSDCRALDESLSVVLSLMVDIDKARLEIAARPPAAPPPAPTPTPPAPEPAPVTTLESAPEEAPPAAGWGWEVAAGAVLGSGLLPGQALGGQAGLSWQPPHAPPFEIYGTVWTASALGAALDVRLRGLVLGAAVCPARGPSSWFEIEGCVGIEGGEYSARAIRIELPEQTGPLVEAIVGPRLRVHLSGGWRARLGVYAVIAAVRTRLVLAGSGTEQAIFESSPISPRVGLDIAWGTAR